MVVQHHEASRLPADIAAVTRLSSRTANNEHASRTHALDLVLVHSIAET